MRNAEPSTAPTTIDPRRSWAWVIVVAMADGLETTRRIRATGGPQPSIVAVTASALASDQQACRQAGMDDFVSKPIRRDDLVAVLRRVSPRARGADAR